jgi:AcrR family transcriptional regulator
VVPTLKRKPLSRDRVLAAGVALADRGGIESLSMRKLADELGVVPMALYKHVAGKEELLDGMVDVIVGEIDPAAEGSGWKTAMRQRILSARRALKRHPWAPQVLESRTNPTPAVLAYMDSMIGLLLDGGFSVDLAHHSMHAIGSRLMGFTQELFDDSSTPASELPPELVREMARRYPNVARIALGADHEQGRIVGAGCDDQAEFEFALDLMLDGLDRAVARPTAAR